MAGLRARRLRRERTDSARQGFAMIAAEALDRIAVQRERYPFEQPSSSAVSS